MNHDTLHNRLVERVTFEAPTITPDDMGGHTTSWAVYTHSFAEVLPVGPGRRNADDVRVRVNQYTLTVRPDDGIVEAMRVRWQSITLRITAITRFKHHIEISCESEVL